MKNNKIVNVNIKQQTESYGKSKKNPKSAQDTLPWDEVYTNGIFRCGNNFSLRFFIQQVNYKTKKDSDKDITYDKYQTFLSSLPSNINYQEFIVNSPFDKELLDKAMIPKDNQNVREDILQDYQSVMSNIVDKCVSTTCNQLIIGVISFEPKTKLDNINILFKIFDQFEILFSDMDSKITMVKTEECFEILHNIYHSCDNEPFLLPSSYIQHDCKLKDYIAPSHFTFKSKLIEVGSTFSSVMFVRSISKSCDDEFITDLLDNNYKITISKHLKKLEKAYVFDMLKRQMEDLEMRLEKRRENNKKHGGEFIPYSLQNREKELTELQDKLGDSNCDMFQMGIYILVSAETEEELRELMLYIKQKALEHQVKIDILSGSTYQEKGLKTICPFANPVINADGTFLGQPFYLLTNEVGNFIPFSNRNVFAEGGIYYGINKTTKAPILINRSDNMNGNAFTLGPSGSGKSMNIKSELYAIMTKFPNDEVIVIDPENEYSPLAKSFNGEVIKLSPNSTNYLNIFDTDLSFVDEGTNAVALKSNFIMSFIEVSLGRTLTGTEKAIIDRYVLKVYADYQNGRTTEMPTLENLYYLLLSDESTDAKTLATTLELYVTGSFNIFAHHTNVEYHKKFIVFDINELGEQLKTVGLLVTLELLWQRVVENKAKGVRTWVFTDEFSVMFNDTNSQIYSTGDFFVKVYKRIRKYGGNACGATQNISDVLESKQACSMLNNSDFVTLLNQKPSDLEAIINQWHLSESQVSYINSSDVGTGLIISGSNVIPFENLMPTDSLMYKICTTKFEDKQKEMSQ